MTKVRIYGGEEVFADFGQDFEAGGLPTLTVQGQRAKGYSSLCKINLKKASKCFFLSQVLEYYEVRPPKPATQVASPKTPFVCTSLEPLRVNSTVNSRRSTAMVLRRLAPT